MHLIRLSCENGNPGLFVLPCIPARYRQLGRNDDSVASKADTHADSRPEIC